MWTHDQMIYVLCVNKNIVKLTNYFAKKYKIAKEKVRAGTIEDLIKEIIEHNSRVLMSIREGKIIYDPLNFLASLKLNIRKGLMIGTKEAILKKFFLIKESIKEIERTKLAVFDNIYTSTLEAAQTALILKGHSTLVPRLVPKVLEKNFLGKGLEKREIDDASEIIKVFKDYEHKKISLPSGKKLDDLAKKSEFFRESIKKII